MRKFYNCNIFRRNEHDRISTAICGGHDDDVSCCSLSVGDRKPSFHVRKGGIPRRDRLYLYYGTERQYEVRKVSDIRANDYVFAHRSNSAQDRVDMIEIYKACSKALEKGKFVFQTGPFDCGNKYLEAANLYDPDKPRIKPDRLFPYYFRSSSPIKGRVTWDEMCTGRYGTRHIYVINLDVDEDLPAKIPDGTIIYIGGDHSRQQLASDLQYINDSIDRDLALKTDDSKEKPSVRIYTHENSEDDANDYKTFSIQRSSRCSLLM